MQSVSDARTYAPVNFRNTLPTDHAPAGADVVPRSGAAAVAGGAALGLVPSQTSDTPTPSAHGYDRIQIIPAQARLKRLQCSVLTAARLHTQVKSKWRQVMVTTTYRPGQYWDPKDITGLVKCVRQWLARRSIEMRYVWVMEYTKKGNPHYHMIVWLPLGITLPFADKRGWWTKGISNQVWARSAVGYLAKYVSKGSDLVQYVRGARHHGNGGLEGESLLEQRWWKLPGWLRDTVAASDRVRRADTGTGGGYVNPGTGECFLSPYEIFFEHGHIYIQMKSGVV